MTPAATRLVNRLGERIRIFHRLAFIECCLTIFNLGWYPIDLINCWAFDRPISYYLIAQLNLGVGVGALLFARLLTRRVRRLRLIRRHIMLVDSAPTYALAQFHLDQADAALDNL